jgi:hypothetical protein
LFQSKTFYFILFAGTSGTLALAERIQLPPALAGGIKLELYEIALTKIIFFFAKAKIRAIGMSF